jgi:hypothetical protein
MFGQSPNFALFNLRFDALALHVINPTLNNHASTEGNLLYARKLSKLIIRIFSAFQLATTHRFHNTRLG